MISLYNTLTGQKDIFLPENSKNVKMYVCGPTVYDFAHIGNARAVVVYDLLYRLLKQKYDLVTYVRNITDIDDKIINVAQHSGVNIDQISERYAAIFSEDMNALGCCTPSFEPKATDHIGVMIEIISRLLASDNAYATPDGHVYFWVKSYPQYGKLSGRCLDKLILGSRVDIDHNKRNPEDFVLWKPATSIDRQLASFWLSPWGEGRPGWHIECSAMSYHFLGKNFDIHGGGADLQFPHHENEIAQSRCAFADSQFAKYWIHNGFVTVNGSKMSKSLGNFITVHDLLNSGIRGEVVKYALMSTHYRKPLDWTDKLLSSAKESLDRLYNAVGDVTEVGDEFCEGFIEALSDDMNVAKALAIMHDKATEINKSEQQNIKLMLAQQLLKCAKFFGFFQYTQQQWFEVGPDSAIELLIKRRLQAKKNKNFMLADQIREQLLEQGVILSDKSDGTTVWHKKLNIKL